MKKKMCVKLLLIDMQQVVQIDRRGQPEYLSNRLLLVVELRKYARICFHYFYNVVFPTDVGISQ